MSTKVVSSGALAPAPARIGSRPVRIAFLGARVWLDGCAPSGDCAVTSTLIELPPSFDQPSDGRTLVARETTDALERARATDAEMTIVFNPAGVPAEILRDLPGPTLGLHPSPDADAGLAAVAGSLDRIASFFPWLTGMPIGQTTFWRAIPPPVSDAIYADVRRPRTALSAMTVGRASDHRERMLLKAKHHHDLLQVVHGLSGDPLIELLREYDVGVYVSPWPGGAYGAQIGMHLAAGQLLLAEAPTPAHGLERNIDYLHFDSADGLTWILDRLKRFPEMYHRIRVRGHLKAEQYRASRVFARIAHDLLADVRAFGSGRTT